MKLIRTVAALVSVASILSACGGGSDDVGKELGLTPPEVHFIHAIPSGPNVEVGLTDSLPADAGNVDSSKPTIFTAIQQQLGLKLESQKALVDVLMTDHAEKPIVD